LKWVLLHDDINTSPQAGLGWITNSQKSLQLRELKKTKEEGVTRKLVAFEMQELCST
jgi:aminomethyltransferase